MATDSAPTAAPTPRDEPALRTDPHHDRRTLLIIAGLFLLGLAVTLPIDPAITRFFHELAPDDSWRRRALKLSAHLFKWWSFVALGVYLLTRQRGRQLLIGYLTCIGVGVALLHSLKFVIGRARPELGLGPFHFDTFGDPRLGFDAFPSGHTTISMLFVALLGVYLPAARWVFLPAAVLTALGRLAQERHFGSDLVAGTALAFAVVHFLRWRLGPRFFP